uniref:Kinesin-like protein n=1 Tax=Globisporangium ultimum (strain ATCC 200006 / CBS 805.95 / DAOM BR144) TaxID=431595 RepID=K3WMA2_GLOUD
MVKWHIGTYARLRPPRRGHDCAKFLLNKLDDGCHSAAVIAFPPPDDDDERLHMKQRDALQFQFTDIFDPSVSQDQVFNRDIVYSALDGYNGTILAYGQTGSGKTYTITGGEHYADRGIIPRVLSTVFEEFETRVNVRYSCYISYLEIYNESVYDLLDRSHMDRPIEEWTKVLLLDDDEGEMHFRNLGVYEAVSEEEALNLLFLGNMNRVTSDTPMNQASSRSHSIFTVMIEARPIDSDIIVTSKLHLVDLAGSERVYKREGTQRMRSEGKHINLSLHHLEQVILSLRAKKKNSAVAKGYHIPYRNSMLTSVLRGSLGGNCKSVFIATLNPENEFTDESISTCRFMQRCSEVSVDIAVNSEIDSEKRIAALEHANSQLERDDENDEDPDEDEDEDKAYARRLYQEVTQELSDLGIEYAFACLSVMKDSLFFASNTAVELQDMMAKQSSTVAFLEQRVHEQKQDAKVMKQQIQQLTDAQSAVSATTMIPRSKSHSGAVASKRHAASSASHNSSRDNSSVAEFGDSDSDSDRDSDRDSETVVNHQSRRQQQQQQMLLANANANNRSGQSALSLVMASGSNKLKAASSEREVSVVESDRSSYDDLRQSNGSNGGDRKENAVRSATLDSKAIPPAPNGSANPSSASGSEMLRKRMELLKNGSLFVKYGRFGRPHVRFVWCSPDLEYLNYRTLTKQIPKASIPTRSIHQIHLGQATKVFERAKQESRAPFCFSVEYDDNRTLDLEIADGESVEQKKLKRAEWTEALQFLVKLKAAAQKKPSMPPPPVRASPSSQRASSSSPNSAIK